MEIQGQQPWAPNYSMFEQNINSGLETITILQIKKPLAKAHSNSMNLDRAHKFHMRTIKKPTTDWSKDGMNKHLWAN